MKHGCALVVVRVTVALRALAVRSPIMAWARRGSPKRRAFLAGGAALLAGAALLSGCGSSPIAAPSGSLISPGRHPGASILLLDRDNRRTLSVRAGSRVTVRLDNTYWTFAPASGRALRQDGTVLLRAVPPGSQRCVPGEGCGTVAVAFEAVRPGRQTIVATRTSCGEAMRCNADKGHYQVTIVVR
jgi:hypothetical protein